MTEQDNGPITPRVSTGVESALERVALAIESLRTGLTGHEADVLVQFGKIATQSLKSDAVMAAMQKQLAALVDQSKVVNARTEKMAVILGRLDAERENDHDDVAELKNTAASLRGDVDQLLSVNTYQQAKAKSNGNGRGHE